MYGVAFLCRGRVWMPVFVGAFVSLCACVYACVCVCVYIVAWEEVGGLVGDDGNILNLSSI